MALEFFRRASGNPAHLGILAGAFNPVTVAHLGLAQAALGVLDEVVFVLPRQFPHKSYEGAAFPDRLAMLRQALADESRFSIVSAAGGLFREIAAECRQAYGARTKLSFLCGRDAAERVVNWDYGDPLAVERMLRDFGLLVAARGGSYIAPPQFSAAVSALPLDPAHEAVSASEARRRISCGEDWEALLPPAIREYARRIYCPTTGK